ncbi:amidase domain-containing protein [Clostridium thermobutyricum]|uniref:Putative amidase domain-containing protein n=1 Tax=Clostridium thermobutyricum TaxID=29372 RepID=N9WAS1_9CLOT|nr:amidase domain-containing protein [Clostridium thermobutyricum]ENY99994.1 hypothetical protein HMPREF1092_03131 [Clostridium thermobutyricum]
MKKFLSVFATIAILSTNVLVANAKPLTTSTKDISNYTVYELENIFEKYCFDNNLNLEKNTSEYESFLRNFLLNENYSIKDTETIKQIRAYAAIYLNRDYLDSENNNNNNIVKKSLLDSKSLDSLTVGDVKDITEEDDRISEVEKLYQSKSYSGYSASSAISYAKKHAKSPNGNYADFTSLGGDCTNFVSQAIYAGKVKQVVGSNYGTNGWFYKTSTQRSATWTGANQFGNYWRGKVGSYSGRYKTDIIPKAKAGDIIQYKEGATGLRYHSLIVTQKLSNDLNIAQRTDNYVGSWVNRGGIPPHGGYETYFDLIKFAS